MHDMHLNLNKVINIGDTKHIRVQTEILVTLVGFTQCCLNNLCWLEMRSNISNWNGLIIAIPVLAVIVDLLLVMSLRGAYSYTCIMHSSQSFLPLSCLIIMGAIILSCTCIY